MKRFIVATIFLLLSISTYLSGLSQIATRSGARISIETRASLRQFPCAGKGIAEEYFESNTLPAGWINIDRDGLEINPNIAGVIGKGWNSVTDFKASGNRLLASASWHAENGNTDNWLISPKVKLGANTCLSWYAYSVDRYFPEAYEVRVSTTPNIDSLLTTSPVLRVDRESFRLNYRSVNLSDYAGQEVYISFRHITPDGFILALDDIRFAEVAKKDVGIFSLSIRDGEAGENFPISGALINLGSDTLKTTGNLRIIYQIDAETPDTMRIRDTLALAPNDTLDFTHSITWQPTVEKVYYICLWYTTGTADEVPSNDTICVYNGIGTFTSTQKNTKESHFSISPNPTLGDIYLQTPTPYNGDLEVRIINMQGRLVEKKRLSAAEQRISLHAYPAGMYLLTLFQAGRRTFSTKILKLADR